MTAAETEALLGKLGSALVAIGGFGRYRTQCAGPSPWTGPMWDACLVVADDVTSYIVAEGRGPTRDSAWSRCLSNALSDPKNLFRLPDAVRAESPEELEIRLAAVEGGPR